MPRPVVSRRPHARRLGRAALLTLGIAGGTIALVVHQLHASEAPQLPPRIPPHHSIAETRPVLVTLTRDWKKHKVQASMDDVTSSVALWQEMHFDDWDRLPVDIRRRGLLRMRTRFADALEPATWAVMDARDWDAVPQPIRMVVFPMMIDYWVRHYAIGSAFNLPRDLMTDTVSAIVMAESWFQHRADVENEWGNRDIGLGQCSNRCRRDLARMAAEGLLGFELTDEDYLNPWNATRVAVVWFGLELSRTLGDVDLAIRAYNRGFEAACRGEGTKYLNHVRRLRSKYFGAQPDRSATWRALATWASRRASEKIMTAGHAVLPAARGGDEEGRMAASHSAEAIDSVSPATGVTGTNVGTGRGRRLKGDELRVSR